MEHNVGKIKVPISILGLYDLCQAKSVLMLKEYLEKRISSDVLTDLKKYKNWADEITDRNIGTVLHECFSGFFVELTNMLYAQGDRQINIEMLRLFFQQAQERVEATAQNAKIYPHVKDTINKKIEQMLEGQMGIKAILVKKARHVSRNNQFLPMELIHEYFRGEPSFEAEVENDFLIGRADVKIVTKDGECDIWEFKTGKVSDHTRQHELLQVAAYGLAAENEGELTCRNLQIIQLYEQFAVQFTASMRERVISAYNRLINHFIKGTIPFIPMSSICTSCEYKQRCLPLQERYARTGLDPDSEDISHLAKYLVVVSGGEKPVTTGSPDQPPIEIMNDATSANGELGATQTERQDQPVETKTDTTTVNAELEAIQTSQPPIERISPNIEDSYDDLEGARSSESLVAPPDTTSEIGQKVRPAPPSIVRDEENENDIPDEVLGIVLQAQNQPLILSLLKDNQLEGVIKDKYRRSVNVGQVLVARPRKASESDATAIIEIREIQAFPSIIAMPFKKLQGFNIKIITSPFMYYENGNYSTTLFPSNFNANHLMLPSPDEMTRIMRLSSEGIRIGLVTYERVADKLPAMLLPYRFPISYREMGYKNIFLIGSPGKGKTNMLKILINSISQYTATKSGKPPAVIILDNTGQFTELDVRTEKSTVIDQKIWNLLDMDVVKNLKKYKIIGRDGDGTHTLKLSAIDPEMIAVLFPQLPQNSSNTFQNLTLKIFNENPNPDYAYFKAAMIKLLDREDYIHISVKNAVKSALEFGPADYFDKGTDYLLLDDLLVEGQVSTIQVDHIPSAMPVMLYLLMMIHKKKMIDKDDTPLVLILDEAHDIFPKGGAVGYEKDYVKMITQKVRSLARTGRKRKLGLIFASQQPHDVDPEITGVFQTFFILGLQSASANWIKDTLGRQYVDQVTQLETGYARVLCKELHGEVLVPLMIPRAPNKHEE